MYLKSNPLFEAFRIYRESKDIRNTYVDFFSENAFEERRLFILNFYENGVANIYLKHLLSYVEMQVLFCFHSGLRRGFLACIIGEIAKSRCVSYFSTVPKHQTGENRVCTESAGGRIFAKVLACEVA